MSFLPAGPPAGIVFVVSARPNETLQELRSAVATFAEYPLPNLSREDFEEMLHSRGVSLTPELLERFYGAMEKNALYLHLVAQELTASTGRHTLSADEFILRVESNPDDIFTIAFARMKRVSHEWDEVIRPILGALLVAQEPLTAQQIGHIYDIGSHRVREGITRLGGFLTRTGLQEYTLFHQKLAQYLRQDTNRPGRNYEFDAEEEEQLHSKLARWCEQESPEQLWLESPANSARNEDRAYARQHYITHLSRAREYAQLFAVLDAGEYERGKLRFDPSTRLSVLDLTAGCQAAAREFATPEEGQKLLTHLWRYALLRSSLISRADIYPIEAFQTLLALNREREALDLMELLTRPAHKLAVLLLLAHHITLQPGREAEGRQLFSRASNLATTIEASSTHVRALKSLVPALIGAGQLEQAKIAARALTHCEEQAAALAEVSDAYGQQEDWEETEAVARQITPRDEWIRALGNLAAKLEQAGKSAQAEPLWQEVSAAIATLTEHDEQARGLSHLASAFARARRWEQAENTAKAIESTDASVQALSELAQLLTLAEEHERAETLWAEVQALVISLKDAPEYAHAQRVLATALAQAKLRDRAREVTKEITRDRQEQLRARGSIVISLIQEEQWEESNADIRPLERA